MWISKLTRKIAISTSNAWSQCSKRCIKDKHRCIRQKYGCFKNYYRMLDHRWRRCVYHDMCRFKIIVYWNGQYNVVIITRLGCCRIFELSSMYFVIRVPCVDFQLRRHRWLTRRHVIGYTLHTGRVRVSRATGPKALFCIVVLTRRLINKHCRRRRAPNTPRDNL